MVNCFVLSRKYVVLLAVETIELFFVLLIKGGFFDCYLADGLNALLAHIGF